MGPRRMAILIGCLAGLAPLLAVPPLPASAHGTGDDVRRIAIVSAFAPELAILRNELDAVAVRSMNGVEFAAGSLEGQEVVLFLSGVSVVNAAMTTQLALDHFAIDGIVFSGIAGGVDPGLRIGDVVIADRWGQYLELVFARDLDGAWGKPPFFGYPFSNYGMMFPRSVTVQRTGSDAPETRFWFPVDAELLERARRARGDVTLKRCTADDTCLAHVPEIVVGGPGVSGGAFVDNAAFRDYTFATFGARVLDMESAAVAHVAWSNDVPFIAIRSLSDLAGGSEDGNQIEVFFRLAAGNSAEVVKGLLRSLSE